MRRPPKISNRTQEMINQLQGGEIQRTKTETQIITRGGVVARTISDKQFKYLFDNRIIRILQVCTGYTCYTLTSKYVEKGEA